MLILLGYLEIIKNQLDANYNINISVLAVHRLNSLLSAMERQQEYIEYGLPPRAVSIEHHDRAYVNIYNTLREVFNQDLVQSITIYRRGERENAPVKKYSLGDTKYRDPIEALNIERSEDLKEILANKEEYSNRIDSLLGRISNNPNNNVKDSQITQLESIKKDFEKEIEQNSKNGTTK